MNDNPYSNRDKQAYRIAYLISGYIKDQLSEPEHDELDQWVSLNEENMRLFEELTDEKNIEANLVWMDEVRSDQAFAELKEAGAFEKKSFWSKQKLVWVAAASIIIIAGTIAVNQFNKSKNINNPVSIVKTDVEPGGNKAILKLADGTSIDLNQVQKGLIKNDDGITILKSVDGRIDYQQTENPVENAAGYHELTTPRGGQYNIILPDGSRVWLNSESSIRYPVAFTGNERKVFVTGETFFEVAKDKEKPFSVVAGDVIVEALGTQFNVNAYSNEPVITATLVEGAVMITKGKTENILRPGQQARVSSDILEVIPAADMEEITGWKEGQFIFHDADIQAIMRQLARWYDVEVIYNTNTSKHFNASISRDEPLSRLLQILELTDAVHLNIENNKVYVSP